MAWKQAKSKGYWKSLLPCAVCAVDRQKKRMFVVLARARRARASRESKRQGRQAHGWHECVAWGVEFRVRATAGGQGGISWVHEDMPWPIWLRGCAKAARRDGPLGCWGWGSGPRPPNPTQTFPSNKERRGLLLSLLTRVANMYVSFFATDFQQSPYLEEHTMYIRHLSPRESGRCLEGGC